MGPVFPDPIYWLFEWSSHHDFLLCSLLREYVGYPRATRGGYCMHFPRSRHWPAGGQSAERCDRPAGAEAGTQHRLLTGPLTAGSDLDYSPLVGFNRIFAACTPILVDQIPHLSFKRVKHVFCLIFYIFWVKSPSLVVFSV